ncbi:PD-(D/E)XK motif protein [Micromonospora chokoriensis]
MTDVAEHFVLLEAESRQVAGSALLTRPVGLLVEGHEVLIAVDAAHQRHLLIPLADARVESDDASQGVTLRPRALRMSTGDIAYLDIHCQIASLGLVFERLAEDVISRLLVDASAPVATCRRVLDEWRALLRAATQGVSRDVVVGLVGELEVLRLLARHDAAGALDAWRGPDRGAHDLVRGGHAIEVKTVTSVDGSSVSISNLDQLDSSLVEVLHLVVVHAREDPTGPSLDERIDALISLGVPRSALLARISQVGYVYESGVVSNDRFVVRSVRAWEVGESFPGLRRSDLSEDRLRGVSRIRYELLVDSAPPRLSDVQFEQLIARWVTAG